MKTLYMKISGFEEESQSLLVSFASDETASQDPAVYPVYAFQPIHMWPDVSDPAEIKKRIAIAGIYHAEQQAAKEKFVADAVLVQSYRDMVGQTDEYAMDVLTPTDTSIVEI